MWSMSKVDSETSISKGEMIFSCHPTVVVQNKYYRSGVLSSAKSGSSRHPSSSPPLAAPRHHDKEGEKNTIPPARAQTAKGIARVFEDSSEETEEVNPVQRPRTQRHVPDGMRSLHETEASPGARTQGTNRGGRRPSRRCADGRLPSSPLQRNRGATSKKQSKSKAREAPRFLGDGEDGDDELLLEGDRKGKTNETVPDEKEIEAFLADASSEE